MAIERNVLSFKEKHIVYTELGNHLIKMHGGWSWTGGVNSDDDLAEKITKTHKFECNERNVKTIRVEMFGNIVEPLSIEARLDRIEEWIRKMDKDYV